MDLTKEVKQMSTYARIIVLALVCILSPSLMWSQGGAPQGILQAWTDEGFEDIRLAIHGDTLFAQIEDHSYRGTFRGPATALRKAAEQLPELSYFELLLTEYQMPQMAVHAALADSVWTVRADYDMATIERQLKRQRREAKSDWKVDITVFPMLSLVNNKLDHLFDWAVRLAPAVAVTPWKGGRITLQPIFPIAHRLGATDTKRCVQIGVADLRQQILSSRLCFAEAAAGFFYPDRVGLQAKAGLHASRNLDLYIDGGVTYKANNSPSHGFGVVRNSRLINVMAHADYYEAYTKLQIELQGGRFLYGDYGGRLDVTRHFGEYAIGLYGILTGGEHNAGFHFAIPFGGKRQKRTKAVRLRLPEYYAMEYSMQSFFKYWEENMGQSFATLPDQNRAAHYWEPRFVEEYIQRILNGNFK